MGLIIIQRNLMANSLGERRTDPTPSSREGAHDQAMPPLIAIDRMDAEPTGLPDCKIASNTDPTPKTSQRIDNVEKDSD